MIEQEVSTSEYVVCVASGAGMSPNNLARDFKGDVARYAAANPGRPLPDGIGLHSLLAFVRVWACRPRNEHEGGGRSDEHASVRMMDRYAHLTPSTVGEPVRGLAEEVGT